MPRRTRSNKRKKRSGAGGFLVFLFLVLLAAAGAAGWFVLTPFGPSTETFVHIVPGSSTIRIGSQLESAGIVRNQYAFDLLRWTLRRKLKAGTYRFDQPAAAFEVYNRIARGDVFTIALTIPEGANIFDIATRVQQVGLGSREEFLAAAAGQTALIADLDPNAKSLEGYLFPDTYKFSPPVTPAQMMAVMVRRFRTEAARVGLEQNVHQQSVHQIVTLASLVERETAVQSERPLVASVFANRLSRKMPLMADPAVIYGLELEGRWRGTIYRSDLRGDTAYNDYLHAGLPPGPIANPGIPSLLAALHPADTNYLYFVAAGDNPQGHSLFSATLDEHNRNVAGYRKAMKQAGAQ